MIKINLLPWREERRKWREQAFYKMLVGYVILTVIVMGLVHLYVRWEVKDQEARNRFFSDTVIRLTGEVEEARQLELVLKQLADRYESVGRLSRQRYEMAYLLDELVKSVPEGVFLGEVERRGEMIFLKGKAESNTRVSQFMRSLTRSIWFYPPALTNIEAEANNLIGFSLTIKQHEP